MVNNLISMILGMASVTREKVDDLANFLVEQGDMQSEEARKVAERILEKGEEEKSAYTAKLEESLENLKSRLVTREDIEELEKKIEDLSRKLEEK